MSTINRPQLCFAAHIHIEKRHGLEACNQTRFVTMKTTFVFCYGKLHSHASCLSRVLRWSIESCDAKTPFSFFWTVENCATSEDKAFSMLTLAIVSMTLMKRSLFQNVQEKRLGADDYG